jgi:sodium transport system permease protein
MLKDARIIFRKEMRNAFKDKRTIFSNYVLPFLLMPALFLAITFFQNMLQEERQEQVYEVGIVNAEGTAFMQILSQQLRFTEPDASLARPQPGTDPSELSGNALWVVFPEGYQRGDQSQVAIYANSTSTDQSYASEVIRRALQTYEQQISNERLAEVGLSQADLNTITISARDTAPEESQGANFLAIFLPYVIIIYLFAGSMSMGIDTTAGEKERGSLSSLLVNQVSRSSIALGKIGFVVASSLLNSIASFAGLLIAFSLSAGLFGSGAFAGTIALTPLSVVNLLLVLLTGSGLAATLLVLLGSFAGSLKEAQGYIGPVYILVIVIGVVTMNMDPSQSLGLYLVPVLNVIFSLKAIILSQATLSALLLTLGSNIVFISVLTYLTSRLYNSERILAKS